MVVFLQEALLLLLSVLFLLFWLQRRRRHRGKRLNLPPGPWRWPLLGNLPQIASADFPHKAMMKLTAELGPVVFLQLGAIPTLVIDSPAAARDVLLRQDHVFASRPSSIACQHFTYAGRDIAFAPYGPHWRAARRIASAELLSARKLAAFRTARAAELDLMLSDVRRRCRNGELVPLRDVFATLSLSTLTRMLLGRRHFGPLGATEQDAAEHKKMIYDGFALVNAFNVADYLPFLRALDLQGHERKMKTIMQRTDEVYNQILAEHRDGGGGDSSSDFVHALMASPGVDGEERLSDETIKAIIIDMISAGTDTSSVTSEWVMAELMRNPEKMRRAQEELDAVVGPARRVDESDLPRLPYVRAAVKEAMRLHPVGAFLIPHFSTADARVAGYDVPKGTRILVNNYSLGRSAAAWGQDSLRYRPERFLEGGVPEVELSDGECRMLPFGAGRRSCPGAALGSLMLLMAVARLLHAFHWSPPLDGAPIDVTEQVGFTVLNTPLQLRARPRLSEPALYEPTTAINP